MLSIRIGWGRWVLVLDAGQAEEEPEELEEPELPALPFGFAQTERAEPAPDPVFRDTELH